MVTHHSRYGIAGDIGTVAFIPKSPADFIAVSRANNTALASLPAATTVNVPLPDVFKLMSIFVADGKVANSTWPYVGKSDVALSTLTVDSHLTSLGNAGITVLAQHHLDVKVVQLRFGEHYCC